MHAVLGSFTDTRSTFQTLKDTENFSRIQSAISINLNLEDIFRGEEKEFLYWISTFKYAYVLELSMVSIQWGSVESTSAAIMLPLSITKQSCRLWPITKGKKLLFLVYAFLWGESIWRIFGAQKTDGSNSLCFLGNSFYFRYMRQAACYTWLRGAKWAARQQECPGQSY